MMKISIILNIYNEAYLLEDCLKSVAYHADEIIVTDMQSSDGGPEIARKYGCKIITIQPSPIVEETIALKVQQARNEWILSLDPDMRVPEETWTKAKDILLRNECDAIVFHMANRVFGRWVRHGHGSDCSFYKLFRKSLFLRNGIPEASIHGMVRNAVVGGRILFLDREFSIQHLAYEDVYDCFVQHLKYAKHEAQQRVKRGERFSYLNMFWQPLRKFLGDFGPRAAWKGGMPSILFSFIAELMVFQVHAFLWYESIKCQNHD